MAAILKVEALSIFKYNIHIAWALKADIYWYKNDLLANMTKILVVLLHLADIYMQL